MNRPRLFRDSGSVAAEIVFASALLFAALVVIANFHWRSALLKTTESGRRLPPVVPPICGRLNDEKAYVPPEWTSFKVPAAGESYVDPVFGCTVERLTDSRKTETLPDGTHPSENEYYSTLSPMSADDSLLLIGSSVGAWRVLDPVGKVVVPPDKMPAMNSGHPVWDASDGKTFYYAHENSLFKGTVDRGSVRTSLIHTFPEYRGIVSPDAADLSQDGDHIALVGQNANGTMNVFVWSLKRQTTTSTYTTVCKVNQWGVTQTPQPGCVHKLLLTADNLLAIDFADDGGKSEEGLRLWTGKTLEHLQDGTNHIDTGYDLDGRSIFIGLGGRLTLSGERNSCPSGWGLEVRQIHDIAEAVCLLDKQPPWHVSYRGGPTQPWAAVSFFDDRNKGPELFSNNPRFEEPDSRNWQLYEDEVDLVRIDGAALYRLADARSRSAENYWAQPHAAISRDGKYIIFDSNMAYPNGCPSGMHVANECTDVYLIKVR